ncbi:hypothetical protein ACUHMQ_16530, partial [Chitinimonas sp. PSY-7]|uniref:hypothetical protein n=1 Tax=Chitinimonas sp. PSY-7 TaxID=3459088 RepID=UPI00403FD73F
WGENGEQCGSSVARSDRLDKPRVVTSNAEGLIFSQFGFQDSFLLLNGIGPVTWILGGKS